jgi:hypothetical protein
VPFPEKLFEKYEVQENAIYANVNASKIIDVMKRFVEMHNESMFFILEIPCKEDDGITDSKTLINANDDYDVYFIDGLDKEHINQCLDALGDFLTKDGMNTFGIGGHESHEEILFGKYNVVTIYTNSADEYSELLSSFGIEKTASLVTAWDTFDESHPGECSLYVSEKTGKTIYDIPDAYKECGMYLYEGRKEYDGATEKEITLDELVGKILLVGITYYTSSNEIIEQKQFYGTVTEANESVICIKQSDGTEFILPSDLSSTKRARPGEYKLRSTGEIVTNPDFFATWNLIKGE